MASIHRRKGRPGWTVSWYEGGRKRRAQRSTRRLAENLALQVQLQKDNPDILRPDQLFRTYAEEWLTHKAQQLQEGTTRVYDQALQKHILPAFGSLMLRSIERRHARNFLTRALEQGLAKKTVANLRGTLSAILEEARRDRIVRENVTKDLALKLAPNRGERRAKIKAMTAEQLHAFLRAAAKHEPQWAAGLRVGAFCGLRPGELLGLRWGDVDWLGSQLHVRRSFTRGKVKSTKSGEDRKVDLPPGVLEALRREDAVAKERALAKGERRSVYVLPSLNRTPRDDGYLRQAVQRVLTKAGLPDVFTPHSLRHTYATQHLLAGTSPYYVQKQLGHASITLTVDLYGSWLPAGNAENAMRLEARVVGATPVPEPAPEEKAKKSRMPKNDPSPARRGRS